MSNLSSVIKSIQDIMRQDSGVDGDAQRISQLTWLLFLKVFDALEEQLELTTDNFKSPLPEAMRWRNWAADAEGITGDALLEFVNNQLFTTLKNLSGDAQRNPRGYVVRGVFEDAYNYMKSGQLLRQVINKLNAIDFNRQAERHQFNDLYEKILKDLQSAGNAGEFYTPRAVTQFMVDMVNPKLGERVMDPATGTGGFLVCAIEHLRKQVHNTEDEAILQNSIGGVEKKQMPHMLCVTNLMLHGIEVPSLIAHGNTLARPLRDYTPAERVDVILTNPPFGGIEEPGIEQGFPADVRTKETADLFLVLIKHILKTNGRAALVLPDGTLFGEGVKTRIKEQLLAECNLHTIVRLPNGVFAPYTGIKTNLLFFTKGKPTEHVWYYEHPYPAGVKNYNKTKPIRIEEFDAEKAWWGTEADGFAARVENERAWQVSIEQIKAANYNLDQKNPHAAEVVSHDPEQLLADYARLQTEAQSLRDQLKAMLSQSLLQSTTSEVFTSNWQRTATHFDLVLGCSEAVDTLEQTLLQLAVRGLLIRQDPTDEPANILLQKVRIEKDQLIAQGKIKRDKPLPQISDQEKPFKLPMGWEWARLGDIGVTQTGGTPNKNDPEHFGTDIPFIKPGDIYPEWVDYQNEGLSHMGADTLGRIAEPGSILMVCIGTIGKCNLIDRRCSFNQQINSVTPVLMLPRYMLAILRSTYFQSEAWTRSSTTTISILNKGKWELMLIPVPPLEDQARIVKSLNDFQQHCRNLRTILTRAVEVRRRISDSLLSLGEV